MGSKVGCDLEYALRAPDGRFMPAGVLPIMGRKGSPEPMPTGGVEIDCCAVELTVEPSDNEDGFTTNILRHLNAVKERYSGMGTLETIPSYKFNKDLLERIRHANEMGCSPDNCVWTGKQNRRPRSNDGLRTFGGHIHIEDGTPDTIRACDLTLGMWSVVHDRDNERRKLYGKAGAFRFKDYGVEYRVLSNFWCGDENNIRKAFKLVQKARDIQKDIKTLVKACGGPGYIQDTINNSRVLQAKQILNSLGIDYGT